MRLLGPVAVDGTQQNLLSLGPARQRAVLAALLLDAGHPVSAVDLISRVWGERPPPAADQALRAYLCRLRKILEESPPLRLERRDGGYAAAVDVGQLDLAVFRDRATRARVAVREGRHETALAAYGDALSLAAGELLVGVGSDWLDERRRLLQRERHAVALERNDVALATGAPELVVADAPGRLATEPYDERVAGQVMLALAGVGRTAEALAVFRRVDERLREELGIDAGPALRDVQQRVLRGLEGVRTPTVASPRPAGVVPRQLPPGVRGLVDRATESRELDRLLLDDDDDTPPVVVICGPGGAGKTALAVHWARQHRERYPDGQLYVDLHGFDPDQRPTAPSTALRGLLAALGVDPSAIPTDPADMIGSYRSLLAERRILLLADDVGSAEQLRPLLPPGHGSATLVTSRSALPGLTTTAGAQLVALGLLGDTAARELLGNRVGPSRTNAEPAAVDRLLSHCGGLPLALAIVAGRAASLPSLPLSVLADELADESRRVTALSGGYDVEADLAAVVASSVATLSAAATSVLQWFAAGPRISIQPAATAALADLTEPQAENALRELQTIHLLEPDGPQRCRLHDLVRLAVRARPVPGLDRAVDRLLRFLITDFSVGGPPAVRTDRWPAVDDLLSAFAYASQTGRDTAQSDIVNVLDTPLGSAGRWSDLVLLHEQEIVTAERLGDDRRRANGLIGRGRGRIGLREFAAAEGDLVVALATAERVGDLSLRARAHRALARLGAHQHEWTTALHHDQAALVLHRRCGDALGEAHAHNAIGWHLAHLGRAEESLDSCRRALPIFVDQDDSTGQALTHDSVGYALTRLGRTGEARVAYRRAVDLCRRLDARVMLANTLLRLADAADRVGDPHDAAAARAEAEEILRLSGRQILEP